MRRLCWFLSIAVFSLAALWSVPTTRAQEASTGAQDGSAYLAELSVKELGQASGMGLQFFYQPDLVPTPAGHLVFVYADEAYGEASFLVATDIAFELGDEQVYRVEFEQCSNMLGDPLGGRLKPGDSLLGFIMLPSALRVGDFFGERVSEVTVRYAHHRASFRDATLEEKENWTSSIAKPQLMTALNHWWEWVQLIEDAPPMNDGEAQFFAERIFPGQGHILAQEEVSPEAIRNAITRVGERRLLTSAATQRVAPNYPQAARAKGVGGLVVVLVYLSQSGQVEDALVLSSSTVHMLNMSALKAATEWRFVAGKDRNGNATDGWRLLPFQFRLASEVEANPAPVAETPPSILKLYPAVYPDRARRSRIEGTVVYRARIDERGKLMEASLEKGVHPLLDQAALVALEKTLFSPAMNRGRAVKGEIDVPFKFPEDEEN